MKAKVALGVVVALLLLLGSGGVQHLVHGIYAHGVISVDAFLVYVIAGLGLLSRKNGWRLFAIVVLMAGMIVTTIFTVEGKVESG